MTYWAIRLMSWVRLAPAVKLPRRAPRIPASPSRRVRGTSGDGGRAHPGVTLNSTAGTGRRLHAGGPRQISDR